MLRNSRKLAFGYISVKDGTIFFDPLLRGFCSARKRSKRTEIAKVLPSKDSKLKEDPGVKSANCAPNNIDISKSDTVLPCQKDTTPNDPRIQQKKQRKSSKKSVVTESEKESKEELLGTLNSILDHYGESLNKPGMKPLSISRKKRSTVAKVLDIDKVPPAISVTNEETVRGTSHIINDIDLTEVIPKIRAPSARLERRLEVPSEWSLMGNSWTPSSDFLNSILNFPIGGLEKSCSYEAKNTEYVNCFVTSDKTVKTVPAVTTVLSKTMTSAQAFALNLWRKKLIQQLGEEGFLKHKNEILTRGKQFHDTIQRYLHGEPVRSLKIEDLPLITGCWKSLVPFLNSIDDVIAVESEVLHPRLLYRGIIDCIVEIRGQPFIVEWKHSSRKRESLQKNYDSPVQLMAYTGAINSNDNYPFSVKHSLLVVAYDDGSPADVFLLSAPENGEFHWNTWLKRLHTYWIQQRAAREVGD